MQNCGHVHSPAFIETEQEVAAALRTRKRKSLLRSKQVQDGRQDMKMELKATAECVKKEN